MEVASAYNSSLSLSSKVSDYFDYNGLLQFDSHNQKIWNTEKGLRFLQLCDQTGDLMEEGTAMIGTTAPTSHVN
jgi:hypothetical protein